jgi:hypothetical protein
VRHGENRNKILTAATLMARNANGAELGSGDAWCRGVGFVPVRWQEYAFSRREDVLA